MTYTPAKLEQEWQDRIVTTAREILRESNYVLYVTSDELAEKLLVRCPALVRCPDIVWRKREKFIFRARGLRCESIDDMLLLFTKRHTLETAQEALDAREDREVVSA